MMYLKLLIFCLFVGSLQNVLVTAKGGKYKCKERRRFYAVKTVKGIQDRVHKVSILCTSPATAYDIRYVNGSVCACGQTRGRFFRRKFACMEQLALDVIINVSTNNVRNSRRARCDINLSFHPVGGGELKTYHVFIQRPRETSSKITSSKTLSSTVRPVQAVSTPTIAPDSTNTGLLPIRSLIHTPNLPSSPQSIHHTSVPSTVILPTHSVFITSSRKEGEALKSTRAEIRASPSMQYISPSKSLSFEREEEKKFKEDIAFLRNFNTSAVKIEDKETIARVLDAATNLIKTNQTTSDEEDPGTQAIEVLQDLGNSISQQLDLRNESSVTFQEVTDDLVFGAAVINVSTSPEFSFPSKEKNVTGDEKIIIPYSVFNSENSGKAYFVGIIFKAYREMRNNTGNEGFVMGTKVINAIVSPAPSKVLSEPVQMMFEKKIAGESFGTECSFWIENNSLSGEHGRWSTKQCFRTFENESHVKCECYHFTNFAVLFKVTSDENVSEEDTFRLIIITYIGLSLSILGCLLTFIVYISLRSYKSDRATIHTNLVVALGIADVIFLITVAMKPDGDSCLALTMLAFYFYLAVFFWMLVEGVYIYLMVVKVFRGNVARRRRLAYLVGWGCPLIIAIVTWAVLRDDVVSKYHCWLSVESGAIWAFAGPGLSIILVNCIILLAAVRTTWEKFSDEKQYGGLKSATKIFGAVIPILGITWVFGVMAFNESSVVFQYIFAITNSIQGALIFVLYILVNKEVRNELNHRITIWQTRREMTSSSSGRRHILMSTQSAQCQKIQDFSQYEPQSLKKKQPTEVGFLLDGDAPMARETKASRADGSINRNGGVGEYNPGKNESRKDYSFDSVGYV